ncbi:uncharacterized protein LOC111326377 [Stylophora pistillata]|uniref:Uncharacterized protein n=1 Tax=Stylophora pistillata TaxID=50429 RepID=A0A2B4SIM9_STYPI|nr:uncharacterized protein LOC111326377 [Stylophora pistillata]PFX28332.1 hypothetical protein AWC38_SpisGene6940 [Stylophora pistillata]
MVEGSLRSVEPLAYYVNTLSDFDGQVIKAYKNKDQERIKQLASTGNMMDIDLFICINKAWHGFVLCVPAGEDESGLVDFSDVLKTPFDVPDVSLCWEFELCMEDQRQRMYKIRKDVQLFRDIVKRIKKHFYIGRFKQITLNALQFVALRAAPHRYSVLLEDCVEFAKEFCVQTLAYSSNWREIEEQVHNNIKGATATGFSAERLSRNIRSSGWLGNTFLGGMDVSNVMSSRYRLPAVIALVLFLLLLYPIFVSVIVIKLIR